MNDVTVAPSLRKARVARDDGRVLQAIEHYEQALGGGLDVEASDEAARCVLSASPGFRGVTDLYRKHLSDFGLSERECPGMGQWLDVERRGLNLAVNGLMTASSRDGVLPAPAARTLVTSLRRLGDTDVAHQHLRLAKRRGEAVSATVAAARDSELAGRLADAAEQYRLLLRQRPGDHEVRMFAALFVAEVSGTDEDPALWKELVAEGSPARPADIAAFRLETVGDYLASPVETRHALVSGTIARPEGGESRASEGDYVRIPDEDEVPDEVSRLIGLVLGVVEAHLSKARIPSRWMSQLRGLLNEHVLIRPTHPALKLVKGLVAVLDGRRDDAFEGMLDSSLELDWEVTQAVDTGFLGRALQLSRGWLVAPALPLSGDRLQVLDTVKVKQLHARALMSRGEYLAGMALAGTFMKPYYVADVPLQYRLEGDYKWFPYEDYFIAVPRHVREFMVVDGKVHRVNPRTLPSARQLPPMAVGLARRVRRLLHWAETRRGPEKFVLRLGVRLARFLWASGPRWAWITVLGILWKLSEVRGVLTADSREHLMGLIVRSRKGHFHRTFT